MHYITETCASICQNQIPPEPWVPTQEICCNNNNKKSWRSSRPTADDCSQWRRIDNYDDDVGVPRAAGGMDVCHTNSTTSRRCSDNNSGDGAVLTSAGGHLAGDVFKCWPQRDVIYPAMFWNISIFFVDFLFSLFPFFLPISLFFFLFPFFFLFLSFFSVFQVFWFFSLLSFFLYFLLLCSHYQGIFISFFSTHYSSLFYTSFSLLRGTFSQITHSMERETTETVVKEKKKMTEKEI